MAIHLIEERSIRLTAHGTSIVLGFFFLFLFRDSRKICIESALVQRICLKKQNRCFSNESRIHPIYICKSTQNTTCTDNLKYLKKGGKQKHTKTESDKNSLTKPKSRNFGLLQAIFYQIASHSNSTISPTYRLDKHHIHI